MGEKNEKDKNMYYSYENYDKVSTFYDIYRGVIGFDKVEMGIQKTAKELGKNIN